MTKHLWTSKRVLRESNPREFKDSDGTARYGIYEYELAYVKQRLSIAASQRGDESLIFITQTSLSFSLLADLGSI